MISRQSANATLLQPSLRGLYQAYTSFPSELLVHFTESIPGSLICDPITQYCIANRLLLDGMHYEEWSLVHFFIFSAFPVDFLCVLPLKNSSHTIRLLAGSTKLPR